MTSMAERLIPTADEQRQILSGYSLYRKVHFFERKSIDELDAIEAAGRKPQLAIPRGNFARIKRQLAGVVLQ